MGKVKDMQGMKFGRLTVLELSDISGGFAWWLCECECGKVVKVRGNSLRTGNTTSCGCLFREKSRERHLKTGFSHTRLYNVWSCMMQRCYNPKNDRYRWYGEIGTKVCDDWKNFVAFQKWATSNGYDENAPRGKCTLDRINPFGNYEPSNCRWVTMTVQNKNKRKHYI